MNNRIKALAEQCGFNTDAMYPGGFPNDNTLALHHFAELIVLECVKCVDETGYMENSIAADIKKHFGIK